MDWAFILRLVGAVGLGIVTLYLYLIYHRLSHPQLCRVVRKMTWFFGIYAFARFLAAFGDSYDVSDLGGYFSLIVTNFLIFYVAYYFRRQHRRLDRESQQNLSIVGDQSSASDTLETLIMEWHDMKGEAKYIRK